MKTALRILAWAALAAIIVQWPTRPTSFNARWVAMPSAMSWQMLNAARKAAERPAAMTYTYCKYPDCKRS
jgi:hypothetical protein